MALKKWLSSHLFSKFLSDYNDNMTEIEGMVDGLETMIGGIRHFSGTGPSSGSVDIPFKPYRAYLISVFNESALAANHALFYVSIFTASYSTITALKAGANFNAVLSGTNIRISTTAASVFRYRVIEF